MSVGVRGTECAPGNSCADDERWPARLSWRPWDLHLLAIRLNHGCIMECNRNDDVGTRYGPGVRRKRRALGVWLGGRIPGAVSRCRCNRGDCACVDGSLFMGITGANVMLGPGVCLARVPSAGRNFECLSGEDPYLGYLLVQPVVQGIQSEVLLCPCACVFVCACGATGVVSTMLRVQGVIAVVEHYLDSNQETGRMTVSANVAERTQYELYLRPYVGATQGGVLGAMCSTNRINGTWACENNATLNGYLKTSIAFPGFVVSDWGAAHNTVAAANAGLDVEMPGDAVFGSALLQAIQNGSVTEATVDDKVLRVLTSMYAVGAFDMPVNGSLSANVTSGEHTTLARALAAESTVLLKNEYGLLPLSRSVANITVVGDACSIAPIVHGNGSGEVIPAYVSTVLQGIAEHVPRATVRYFNTSDVTAAMASAAQSQITILCTAITSGDGLDRANLSLPRLEDAMISAVASVQPRSIVIVTSPGAVLLPWADSVGAILATFLPGQEAGNAAADVLFGDMNPSARLPVTFPMVENQTQFTPAEYPGVPSNAPLDVNYTEGLLIGYRWFDAHNATPRYPFGHGLSYTQFKYSNLQANDYGVTFTVTNAGSVAGAEVTQFYMGFPASSGEPPLQLKGFRKVFLQPGDSETINFSITPQDMSVWSEQFHDWLQQIGTFNVYIGASSRDIRLKGSFDV